MCSLSSSGAYTLLLLFPHKLGKAGQPPRPPTHCRAAGLRGRGATGLRLEPSQPASGGPRTSCRPGGSWAGPPGAPAPHSQSCPQSCRLRPLLCGDCIQAEVTAWSTNPMPCLGPPPWPAPLRELISCWMAREGSMSPLGLRAARPPPRRVQPRTALPRPEPQPGGGAGRCGAGLPSWGGASANQCAGPGRQHLLPWTQPSPLQPPALDRLTPLTPARLPGQQARSRRAWQAQPPQTFPPSPLATLRVPS